MVKATKFELKPNVSFLDYIFGGCKLNLSVAIDFTASNGNQRESDSLHNMQNLHDNQYLHAIRSVGTILQYYDEDKRIPAYGFGA